MTDLRTLEVYLVSRYKPSRSTSWTKIACSHSGFAFRVDYDPNLRMAHVRHDPRDRTSPPWVRSAYYGTLYFDAARFKAHATCPRKIARIASSMLKAAALDPTVLN
jgi:hypothetical protein